MDSGWGLTWDFGLGFTKQFSGFIGLGFNAKIGLLSGSGLECLGSRGFYKINQYAIADRYEIADRYAIADQTHFLYPWEMVVTT